MSLSLKPLIRLLLPMFLLLTAVYTLSRTNLIDEKYISLVKLLPYVIFTIALGLAHYFNRSRFFAAALIMAFSFWVIQNYLQNTLGEQSAFYLFSSISLLVPLALLLLTVLPERGLWNSHGFLPLSIAPIMCAVAFLLYSNFDSDQFATINTFFSLKPVPGYVLSVNASIWSLATLVAGLLVLSRRDAEAEAALCSCLIFIVVTLAFFDQALISTVMFTAAGITLVVALLRSSFEMAYRDDLTGLLGRRALNEKLRGLGRQYVIAMMDVDHFKKFNDTHGHDVGDDVLKVVAANIAEITGGGIPYRYGGEEFAVIFTSKKLKQCIPHLEAVREAIADYSIVLRDRKNRPKNVKEGATNRGKKNKQKTVSVTISIGLAEKTQEYAKPEEVLKASDKALYKAKESGRNCLQYL